MLQISPRKLWDLTNCLVEAKAGEKFVITRYRDLRQNLRTQFMRIIGGGGLEPWPRLFHNLRASRQTELEQEFPGYVVAKWMGNSESVARKHYLMVTEDHYLRAVQGPGNSAAPGAARGAENALHGALRHGAAQSGIESQDGRKSMDDGEFCESVQNNAAQRKCTGPQDLPPRGVEPLSPG